MNTFDKRVLLTGATGFIGRWAIPALLSRGYEVHAVGRTSVVSGQWSVAGEKWTVDGGRWTDRSSLITHHSSLNLHSCDLFDRDQTAALIRTVQPTHLLHFAWYAEHRKFWTSPLNVDWAAASLNLLREFADTSGRRAVFAGTCAEYDWSHEVCSERDTPTRPRTLYGVCKNSLREVSERFADQVGMSFAWGRIFFLFGPGEHPDRFVPSIVRPLLAGQPAACRAGSHVRDFLHVADVADAFASLLDSDVVGSVNIASGEARSLGRVAEYIADRLGHRSLLRVESTPSTPDNPAVLRADVNRLRTEVGWVPRFSLAAGLDDILHRLSTAGDKSEIENPKSKILRPRAA